MLYAHAKPGGAMATAGATAFCAGWVAGACLSSSSFMGSLKDRHGKSMRLPFVQAKFILLLVKKLTKKT
jgi:hypothetical protein